MNTKNNTSFKRIAIGAQSFGFGPVSKACAIAKSLSTNFPELELIYIADSVAKEFIKREGLWKDNRDLTIGDDNISDLENQNFEKLDAAVIVLDPKLASFFQPRVPTYFVDSLGFMWDGVFFKQFPNLINVHTYFVQEIFGAHEKLSAKGVKNLHPVGAIIDNHFSFDGDIPDLIFHLGGLFNIFSEVPIRNYIEGIVPIMEKLAADQSSVLLTSKRAFNEFETLRKSKISIYDLPHNKTLGMFTKANCVFTSPGLTTLLELIYLKVPVIPLPPQNMSQALIINNLVSRWNQAPEVWSFLAKHYQLTDDMGEEEGVRVVQSNNKQLLSSLEFQETYIQYAIKAKENSCLIPSNLTLDFDGVSTICNVVCQSLGLPTV